MGIRILQSLEEKQSSFWSSYSFLEKIIFTIGALILIKFITKLLIFIHDLIAKGPQNLAEKYGRGSYVLITGTTAGIGRALVNSFAELGFNIIQLSRNKEKLERVQSELKTSHPLTKVVNIDVDLTLINEEEIQNKITSKIEGLDISIVVNNAGLDCFHLYHEIPVKRIQDLVNVNVNAVAIVTRLLIPKLRKRKSSAVLCLSSLAGMKPMSYFGVYCATKSFVEMFCATMNKEYPRTLFMSVRPSEVSTQMTFFKPKDIMTISAEQCSEAIINELRRGIKSTNAHWNHKIQEVLYLTVPSIIYDFVWEKFVVADFCRQRGQSPPTKIE